MDFLGLGWLEIGLIVVVALLIWGPNRAIEISRSLGKTIRTIKKAASDLSTQVTRELDEEKKLFTQEKPEKNDGPVKGK